MYHKGDVSTVDTGKYECIYNVVEGNKYDSLHKDGLLESNDKIIKVTYVPRPSIRRIYQT